MNLSFKKMLAVLALTASVVGGDVFAVNKVTKVKISTLAKLYNMYPLTICKILGVNNTLVLVTKSTADRKIKEALKNPTQQPVQQVNQPIEKLTPIVATNPNLVNPHVDSNVQKKASSIVGEIIDAATSNKRKVEDVISPVETKKKTPKISEETKAPTTTENHPIENIAPTATNPNVVNQPSFFSEYAPEIIGTGLGLGASAIGIYVAYNTNNPIIAIPMTTMYTATGFAASKLYRGIKKLSQMIEKLRTKKQQ